MKVAVRSSGLKTHIKVDSSPGELEQEDTILETGGSTLRSLLLELPEKYGHQGTTKLRFIDPLTGEVDSWYEILVNGKIYRSLTKGLDSKLEKGNIIEINMYMLGGG